MITKKDRHYASKKADTFSKKMKKKIKWDKTKVKEVEDEKVIEKEILVELKEKKIKKQLFIQYLCYTKSYNKLNEKKHEEGK